MKYVIVGGVAGGATAAARIGGKGEIQKMPKSFCLKKENISRMPIVVYLII